MVVDLCVLNVVSVMVMFGLKLVVVFSGIGKVVWNLWMVLKVNRSGILRWEFLIVICWSLWIRCGFVMLRIELSLLWILLLVIKKFGSSWTCLSFFFSVI